MRRSTLVVVLVVIAVGCGGGRNRDENSQAADDPVEGQHTGVTEQFSVDDAGFVGTLVVPDRSGRWPAVVLLGGSDGRQSTELAEALAGDGYASLALSYFAASGLPDQLAGIPLEYFETALRWLREQPNVDRDHVIVWGASRGAEAALLVAATYPVLINGVIAAVPTNVATCGLPACDQAAWTLDGEPLPYVDEFDRDHYNTHPEAEIPVERIAGPVLLICGGQDLVWPSCPMSRAIIDRLARNNHQFDHQMLEYPDAGHYVSIPPDVPLDARRVTRAGGTVDANHTARNDMWPKTLAFLAEATTATD